MKTILGKKSPTKFYCFSPQVMVLTFVAEMLLVMYVLVRRGYQSVEHRIVVVLLLLLAIFQLSEYGVCEGLALDSIVWSRIGFVSITMLPPLGLHLIQLVRGDKSKNIAHIGYFLSLVFVVAFTFFDSFASVGCQGNYAIFQVRQGLGGAYFTYYYLLLILGAVMAYTGWSKSKETARGKMLLLIGLGYASFVLPATFIHFVFESVSNGLPSIMCGFALIFAAILGTVVANRLPTDKD